jgi:REase_DpnII-MboI
MTDQIVTEPFDDVTLEIFAHIIAESYTGSGITRFFERAGFPEFWHDGRTKWEFVYEAMQEIQGRESGPSKIVGVIEQFCNPRSFPDENAVNSIDQTLADYALTITSSGKVIARVRLSEAVDIIERIARRFHFIARQLSQRHNGREPFVVRDEYDIQDLFHALLHLYFDDIRPEEYTPSYGGRHSRTDFLIKPDQIFVEIKMTSSKLNGKAIRDQLMIDIHSYHTHPDCKILVAFVYDPDRYIANPRGVEADLSQPFNGLQVKVIVSQG